MKNKQNDQADNRQQRSREPAEDANPIVQNIATVANLYKRAERKVSPQQRAIEAITDFLGRPLFLFITVAFVTLWMLINILLIKLGKPSFDPPPFIWLQGILSLGALLQATVILITQNRQERVTERNRQLDLQASLLLDQKISKLIEMVDELRQACGQKRPDPQAEAMKETVNPHEALSTLERLLAEPGK